MIRRDLMTRRMLLKATVLLAASCSAPPPAAPPSPTTPVGAPPSQATAAPATPPTLATAAARPADNAAWQSIVEAARGEGKVLMYGGVFGGGDVTTIAAAFKQATGIDFDFLPLIGPTAVTRIREEAKIGKAADIFEGTGGWLVQLASEGLLVPLKDKPLPVWSDPDTSWNVHPGYKSPDDWRYVLSRLRQRQGHIGVNTKLLSQADFPSGWHDLATNPRYKGMIAFIDPTISGTTAQEFVMHSYIGKTMSARDLWTMLVGQEPLLFKVARANVISVAQGERAITFPPIDEAALNLIKAGAPVKNLYFPSAPVIAATADMGIIKGGAHPNAAMVFVNWYLGKQAQDFVGRILLQTSIRRDVPSHVPDELKAEVVGGGQRGPMIIDTPLQTQLMLDMQSAGLMNLLSPANSADDFDRAWTDFIKDWEAKHGGPKNTPTIFQP